MFERVRRFFRNEAGAVTVDWVVLSAAIVALVVAIVTAMQTGAIGLTDSTAGFMTSWFD